MHVVILLLWIQRVRVMRLERDCCRDWCNDMIGPMHCLWRMLLRRL